MPAGRGPVDTLSFDTVYAQLKFGFDLASAYLTRPVVLLGLIAGLLVLWRLLLPPR